MKAASGDSAGKIFLWDLMNVSNQNTPFASISSAVQTVALSPDGRWLAAVGQDGITRLWTTDSGSLSERVRLVAGRTLTDDERERFLSDIENK
jgi:WD40 repeat protein